MPDLSGRAGDATTEQERIWPLFKTFAALKVNKVWPHAAVLMLYGWKVGQRRWTNFPSGCICNEEDDGNRCQLYVGCPVHDA